MMKEDLVLHPKLNKVLREKIIGSSLSLLWSSGNNVPGGRGTSRKITVNGISYLIKREARGGLSAKLFPNIYISRRSFEDEWKVSAKTSEAGLAPAMLARSYEPAGPGFSVHTLIEWLDAIKSLMSLVETGEANETSYRLAGLTIGKLHRLKILHGDLNAGNLMFGSENRVWISDFRHSRIIDPMKASARMSNLSRLSRSINKLLFKGAPKPPDQLWSFIAVGYSDGWGEREAWLHQWQKKAERGPGLRRLFW